MLSFATISLFFALYSLFAYGDGISFSRTVTKIANDSALNLTFTKPAKSCKSTDAYGSNDCTFQWGDNITGSVSGKLGHDLDKGSKFTVDLKVDKIIKWSFTCAVCGANCTTTIPVIDEKITIALPDCPIKAVELTEELFNATLPLTSPTKGVKVTATGPITIFDALGATVLAITLDITVQ